MSGYQTSLVKRDEGRELGIIASGEELRLALHGTRQEIRHYLDQVRKDHGRAMELVSADTISAEKGRRRVARLTAEGRIINPSDPGGPGSADEHATTLRAMASEISDLCTPDEGSTLAVHERYLVEFDPDLNPPAVKLTSVSAVRATFTQLIDSYSLRRDSWDFYHRGRDLDFFGHEEFGAILVPDVNSIRMEAISDEGIRQALAARRWPNVQEVSDLVASLRRDTQEPVQAALADRLGALAPWRGSMGELARGIEWAGTLRQLAADIEQISVELARAGITVYRTGRRCGQNRLAEWAVERKKIPSTPSTPSLMP